MSQVQTAYQVCIKCTRRPSFTCFMSYSPNSRKACLLGPNTTLSVFVQSFHPSISYSRRSLVAMQFTVCLLALELLNMAHVVVSQSSTFFVFYKDVIIFDISQQWEILQG